MDEPTKLELGRQMAAKLFAPGKSPQLPVPREIRRDWGVFTTETVLGGVWARPGLPVQTRALVAIAALTALHRPNELQVLIEMALHAGVSREEVCEVIMQMSLYGGFPAAIEGMRVASEVFAAADAEA